MAEPQPRMIDRAAIRRVVYRDLLWLGSDRWPPDSADLFEAGLDSLLVLELLAALEERFGIELSDHEVSADWLQSIDGIARFLESRG